MKNGPSILLFIVVVVGIAVGGTFGVMAHETAYTPDVQALEERLADAEAQIENLNRRLDAANSGASNQSAAIDDLYAVTDELKARIDTGAVTWDQNAEVDDLYRIVDELRGE